MTHDMIELNEGLLSLENITNHNDCQKLCQTWSSLVPDQACSFFTYIGGELKCLLFLPQRSDRRIPDLSNSTATDNRLGIVSGPEFCRNCSILLYSMIIYDRSCVSSDHMKTMPTNESIPGERISFKKFQADEDPKDDGRISRFLEKCRILCLNIPHCDWFRFQLNPQLTCHQVIKFFK